MVSGESVGESVGDKSRENLDVRDSNWWKLAS